jgi:multiple sugar transport system substrate-binding protein
MLKPFFKALLGASVLLSASTAFAATELSMWYHGAGNEVESKIINQVIQDFNTSQSSWVVKLESFPQESYNSSIVAAALAGNLPDIIDVDGPIMPNWAWSGYMAPLQLKPGSLDKFLPGAIGRWNGQLYAVGLWDAACALVTRKSTLQKYGIRVPTLDKPWTRSEFDAALVKLKNSGDFEYPLDLGMAWTGEWYPYAFGPFLQSFGGDIIDVQRNTAEGALNGDAGMAFGQWWKSLFDRKLTPGTSQDGADRDTGFLDGKYAIQLNGNWAALGAVEKLGDDVLFLPSVDFGKGPRIGAASWQFGVSANSKHKDGATEFIQFAIQDKYLTAFSDGIGLIPPTPASAGVSKHYSKGGAMEVFFELSAKQATLRSVTPAYIVASPIFEKALADIANGADVADTLDAAADEINADIAKNNGYK